MVGDPCIGQYRGHVYPCTNTKGLFVTDADKRLSPSLPFPFSHLFQILSDPSPLPPNTHICTYTHTKHTQHIYTLTLTHTCNNNAKIKLIFTVKALFGKSMASTIYLFVPTGSIYSLYRAMIPRGVAGGTQVICTSGELVTRTMT